MERASRELQTGWTFSIIFHALLAVLMMYLTVRQYIPEPQFVEMTWGMLTSRNSPIPEIPAAERASHKSSVTEGSTNESMNLPSRKFLDLPDEVISLRDKKKAITAENPIASSRAGKLSVNEQRSSTVSSGQSVNENTAGKSTSRSNTQVAVPFGSGTDAGGFGDNISMVVQWAGGGSRKLLAGDMPSYPPGVNISAQIKLKVTVLPDGSVKSAAPAQKGDTRLENAAIAKVKLWQFEPLLSAQPQIEQLCTVTFNFTLK
jgi:TonB family protein